MTVSYPGFDTPGLKALVEKHWKYHRPCRHLNWKVDRAGEDTVQLEAAPVFQDILGGAKDGLRVWSAFSMDLSNLFAEPGVEVTGFGFRSHCVECTPTPHVVVRGRFKGQAFLLRLHQEPVPDSEAAEVIDTFRMQVRDMGEKLP